MSGQEWIPVTERLPEVGSNFLVYDTYHKAREDFELIQMGRMTKSWGISCVGQNSGNKTITHWMPLPEPPETDQ